MNRRASKLHRAVQSAHVVYEAVSERAVDDLMGKDVAKGEVQLVEQCPVGRRLTRGHFGSTMADRKEDTT